MRTGDSERDPHFHSIVDIPGLTHELFYSHPGEENTIPEATKEWLESIGAREFDRPMKWHDPNGILFSEEYLRDTPLDKIKAGYEKIPKRMEQDFTDDQKSHAKGNCNHCVSPIEVANGFFERLKTTYQPVPTDQQLLE